MGMKDDEVIESGMVSKQIQNAQRKVEAHNFDIRKNLLDFDDVANDQRKVVYQQRNELLEADSVNEAVVAIREDVFTDLARRYVPENSIDSQWDIAGLEAAVLGEYNIRLGLAELIEKRNHEIEDTELVQYVLDTTARYFEEKEAEVGPDIMDRQDSTKVTTAARPSAGRYRTAASHPLKGAADGCSVDSEVFWPLNSFAYRRG